MFGGSTHVFLVIDRPTGYIRDAPAFDEKDAPSGTLEKKATGEKFTVPQQKSEVTDEFFFHAAWEFSQSKSELPQPIGDHSTYLSANVSPLDLGYFTNQDLV